MRSTLPALLLVASAAAPIFAQAPSPSLEKLRTTADQPGQAPQTFDGNTVPAAPVAVQESTPPAQGQESEAEEPMIDVQPVVTVKPKDVVFADWAAKEGGKIGLKWGAIGGLAAGVIAGAMIGGLPGFLAALGIIAVLAGIGYLVGSMIGRKKAEAIKKD